MCKIYVGLLLLLITGWTYSQTFDCPPNPTDLPNCIETFYPYAYDCEYYWSCSTACFAYLLQCSSGLHFSPNTRTCDAPEIVGCVETTTGGEITTTTTQTTTQGSTINTTTQESTISTTTQETTTTTDSVLVNPSIFFAGRTTSFTGAHNPINFQETEVDRRGDFDGTYFTARTNGYFFFNFNAGFSNARQANYRMRASVLEQLVNLRRYSYSHDATDSSSRDYILELVSGETIWMEQTLSSGGLSATSDGMETSISGFSLHDSMENPSMFSVARDSDTSAQDIVHFDIVTTNYGTDWDIPNNRYVAPVTGTYFFSLSAGVPSASTVRVALTVDGITVAELNKDHTDNNGDDTFSRSLVINLIAGQAVQYVLVSGSLSSNSRLQTSFSGYKVDPYFTETVAWSLHKTSSWSGSSTLYPVDYEEVLVDEGNVYNTVTNVVTIPYNGFYYVHLGAGAVPQSPMQLRLYVNNGITELMTLSRESTNHVGTDTLSRGGIFYFTSGDQLRVQSPSGYEFYGDGTTQRLTSFQGFLILAE